MAKSLKLKYHTKYKKRIQSLLEDPFESNYPEINRTYNLFGDNSEVMRMKINNYLQYFKYVNGFIGYDYLILNHIAFDLLLYFLIQEENLSERDINLRNNELCIQFYLLLNCIYNIKEKFMYFLGCENSDKKLSFDSSVLSLSGIEIIRKCFVRIHKDIGSYCEARNRIVHNTYFINYEEINKISIKKFSFNLRLSNDHESKSLKNDFIISESEIIKLLHSLYDLRFTIYTTLLDNDNIDKNKFFSKFKKDGKIQIFYP
jgi:hypothetical protein